MTRTRRFGNVRGALVRLVGAVGMSLAVATGTAGEHDHHHMKVTEPPVEDPAAANQVAIPDVAVTDQNGRKLRFNRDLVKGRPVVVDFIYTTCTAICSPMTANLREVQKLLGDDSAKVQFISITIDPKIDTPPVLREFSGRFDIGGNWTFVTASPANLAKLQKGFAVSMARKEDHTPLVIIGNDATGQWTRKFGLAQPRAIAAAVRQIAGLTETVQ